MNDRAIVEAVDDLGQGALRQDVPTLAPEGSIPVLAGRLVYLVEMYWLPLSLCEPV